MKTISLFFVIVNSLCVVALLTLAHAGSPIDFVWVSGMALNILAVAMNAVALTE